MARAAQLGWATGTVSTVKLPFFLRLSRHSTLPLQRPASAGPLASGVEWAVLRYWSVKGEYDFLDFGRHTVTFTDPVFGGASVNVRQQISEVKFGINYRFGPGLVPMY